MILEGNITIPYKWTTGATVGHFLAELKANARLVGARCGACSKVYVPPPDVCGECYKPFECWVPLNGEGTVLAITTVERTMPFRPMAAPYTLALVRLDGANTNMLHLAAPGLKAGDRVAARFRAERTGSLLDIEGFAPADQSNAHADGSAQTSVAKETVTSPRMDSSTGGSTSMESVNDVKEVFRALPSRFRREKADENLSYYFSIDDEHWTVLVTPDSCTVQPGKTVDSADCFLKTSTEIFLGTINGTYTPNMSDLMMGRVKTNNPFLLQKFRELFA